MPERREPQDERGVALDGLVEHMQDVLVDGVGLRRGALWHADARLPLGKRRLECADIAGQPEPVGSPPAEQGLVERLAHPLGRQLRDPRRLRSHERQRPGLGDEPVSRAPRDATEDPQRVVAEGRWVHGAQHSGGQVVLPAEGIDPRAGADVAGHRVDGEVATLQIVAHCQVRVGLDAEVGVRVPRESGLSWPDRGLAPRRDDLDALLGAERGPESHADEPARHAQLLGRPVPSQHLEEVVDAVPAHQEIDVLARPPEQLVAQAAPDLVDLIERERAHAVEDARALRVEDHVGGHRRRLRLRPIRP